MTPETARKFESLEAQAQRIMGVFTRAGYEAVAPAIIQPAGVFLDAIGETLRARTYVFTDQDGTELCLRPDLTVPTCRLHLERGIAPGTPARYCYNGSAFRFQPVGADAAHPREFRQAGIEAFGCTDPVAGEVATLALIIDAVGAGGLSRTDIGLQFGDLGLITALLAAVDMPPRWRQRLQSQFWRPHAFRAELKRLTADPASLAVAVPEALRRALTGATAASAETIVAEHLDAMGLEPFGSRAVAEIAETARATVEDARARPLPAATANLIEAYVALQAPAGEAADQISRFASRAKLDLGAPLGAFDARMKRLVAEGIIGKTATFSGSFGRALEYYTGFVFEVTVKGLPPNSPVAGGGRYDGLMRIAGSRVDVPAVGAAIHTERLLSAVAGTQTP